MIQKIYTFDREAFLRCGVDSLFYLYLLRNSITVFKEMFTSIQQDVDFFQTTLQTVPSLSLFSLAADNEIQQNVSTFYTTLQDKNKGDVQCIQKALQSLFVFRSSNIICYSAILSILRLSLLQYPTETLNDILIDTCFQHIRKMNIAAIPIKLVTKNMSRMSCVG